MTKQLTVTISIDPATAARAGKSRVGETQLVLSDEDLAKLTSEQRDALARHVSREEDWRDPLYYYAPPVAEASIETLAMLLDERRRRVELLGAERAKEAEARRARADAEVLAALDADPGVELIWLDCHGREAGYRERVLSVSVPCEPKVSSWAYEAASPEVVERMRAACAAVRAERERLIAAAQPAVADKVASLEAEAARQREEYRAYYSRLSETMRCRHSEGYASDEEVYDAIRVMACEDAGLPAHVDDRWIDTPGTPQLTDEQYAALVAVRERAPKGAKVIARKQGVFRKAEYDDDPEDVDTDGDVLVERRYVARVTWDIGDIEVQADVPL